MPATVVELSGAGDTHCERCTFLSRLDPDGSASGCVVHPKSWREAHGLAACSALRVPAPVRCDSCVEGQEFITSAEAMKTLKTPTPLEETVHAPRSSTLSPLEERVVSALYNEGPLVLRQLARRIRQKKRDIRLALSRLHRKNLAHYTQRPRKGWELTPQGNDHVHNKDKEDA